MHKQKSRRQPKQHSTAPQIVSVQQCSDIPEWAQICPAVGCETHGYWRRRVVPSLLEQGQEPCGPPSPSLVHPCSVSQVASCRNYPELLNLYFFLPNHLFSVTCLWECLAWERRAFACLLAELCRSQLHIPTSSKLQLFLTKRGEFVLDYHFF